MKDVIITNPDLLADKKKAFKLAGKNKIHIVSDFDRTLTKAFHQGKKIPGILSHIDKGNYLEGYSEKAQTIFNKYHPIEISSEIKYEEKNKIMLQWWREVYELLVKCGLDEEVISKAVKDIIKEKKVRLREGCSDFLKNLYEKDIPLIILSATGIGNMVIKFLKDQNLMFSNTHFIGNTLEFDEKGRFKGIEENKIIHVLNKHEAEVKGLAIYPELLKRENIILLGDSLDDLTMAQGIPHKNIIKIGFLNFPEQSLEEFKKNFDIVITNDGTFEYVNQLIKEILN